MPHPPTPEGDKENSPWNETNQAKSAPSMGQPTQDAHYGVAGGMTWTQCQHRPHAPFPAGMCGVPQHPYMAPAPPAAAASAAAAPSKKKPAPKKKEEDEKPDLRFTTEEKLELMSISEQIRPVSQVIGVLWKMTSTSTSPVVSLLLLRFVNSSIVAPRKRLPRGTLTFR